MALTNPQRWARVLLELAWKRPCLPTGWVRVLERNPDALKPEPLSGYVWLDVPGRPLHVPVAHLEFHEGDG
jgi:hypothetical protein